MSWARRLSFVVVFVVVVVLPRTAWADEVTRCGTQKPDAPESVGTAHLAVRRAPGEKVAVDLPRRADRLDQAPLPAGQGAGVNADQDACREQAVTGSETEPPSVRRSWQLGPWSPQVRGV